VGAACFWFGCPLGNKGDQEKLVEEKGKRAEGTWDLDQAGAEKAEHEFSGQL